jgi:hypothetical protein
MTASGFVPQISPAERRWVLGFMGLFLLFTSVPYLLGFSVQGQDYVYTGFVFGVEDGNSYIAKMLSGSFGAWKFISPHSLYPQNGVWIFPFYIIFGKLASPPALHEQLVALFHLMRLGASLLALLATYDFLAFFLVDIRLRRLGLALTALGGGLGWLLVLANRQSWLGSMPLDFYSPEAFGFLSLYGLPHLALGRGFLLWALLVYLRALRSEPTNKTRLLGATLRLCGYWLLIGLVQPLTMAVLGAVLAWHLGGVAVWQVGRHYRGQAVDWSRWRRLAGMVFAAGILPGTYLLYNIWVSNADLYGRAWTEQNLIRSPNPIHYLLAYGLLIPYAFWGGRRLLKADVWTGWLLPGWILLFPLLAYAPLGLQRRLTEGVWVAWITLAMLALEGMSLPAQVSQRRRATALLWLLFPSALMLWVGGLLAVYRPMMPLFRPKDEVSLFEFLQAHAQPGAGVLAAYETGNPMPAWAPVRVAIGHGPESVHLAEIKPLVDDFYGSGMADEQRVELIRRLGVQYVFWGPAERALGDWSPNQAAYLKMVEQAGVYQLFVVVENP